MTFPVEATEATGDERNSLWRRLVEMRSRFAAYETKTSRIFPMFRVDATLVKRPQTLLTATASGRSFGQ